MSSVLAMILAGGEGTRLMPLTNSRSKPAVPFGGSYRLIDFVLNTINNILLLINIKDNSCCLWSVTFGASYSSLKQ